jgi:ABC-type Na+ efflux pump permease subunit
MGEGRLCGLLRQVRRGRGRNRWARGTFGLQHKERAMQKTYDPDKSTTEVRGASPRKMNLRVLVTSMIGIVVLFVIVFVIFSMTQTAPA